MRSWISGSSVVPLSLTLTVDVESDAALDAIHRVQSAMPSDIAARPREIVPSRGTTSNIAPSTAAAGEP
jgi:hypothetical protein